MIFSRNHRCWVWLLVTTLVGVLAAGSSFALTVSDLVDFLDSEVPEELLLRLLESSGLPEELTPADLVTLWEAGASEELLNRLVPPAALPSESASTEDATSKTASKNGIRAYYRDEPGGGQVFILTNLDDDGRRLDGQASSGARTNLVVGRTAPPARGPERSPGPPENWYPPEPEPVRQPAPEAVVYPSLGPSTFIQTSPYFGFAYSLPASHLYPPGSYTHFKLYHQGGRKAGLGHYQLPAGQVFYHPPFPTAGSHPASHRGRWR